MRFRITHITKYAYTEPVSVCQNKAHLRPRRTAQQTCREYRLLVVPEPLDVNPQEDYYGNHVDYFSLHTPHRGLSVTATSVVELRSHQVELSEAPPWETVHAALESPKQDEQVDACRFKFASEFTQLESGFAEYAAKSFTPDRPIVEAAKDLTHRIYEDFKYDPRATLVSTPVSEVFTNRAGVCQDFAHLQISCLRSLGLAARYVSGYLRTTPAPGTERLVGADESHAWLSVYCGKSGWVDFDPTNDVIPAADHVTLAYGRDYGDVCPLQGVYVGGGDHTMNVSVDVEAIE